MFCIIQDHGREEVIVVFSEDTGLGVAAMKKKRHQFLGCDSEGNRKEYRTLPFLCKAKDDRKHGLLSVTLVPCLIEQREKSGEGNLSPGANTFDVFIKWAKMIRILWSKMIKVKRKCNYWP